VVGVADCQISKDSESTLVTYALGSCIAIAIHDAVAGVGGLLHFMLPESSIDPAKASNNPYMFADTGIPTLFRNAYQYGAEKRRLTVRLAGGAQVMDDNGVFNIGKRNYLSGCTENPLEGRGLGSWGIRGRREFADGPARGGKRQILAANRRTAGPGNAGSPHALERSYRCHTA
jgi:chemotaxis receptor (MCP) glutamine deamidase CheD